jgi:ribose transport system substrate-binding protein
MRKCLAVVAVAATAFTLAACGGDDKAATPAADDSGTTADAGGKPLEGKTIWYADVVDSNPILTAIAQGINQAITEAGGETVRSLAINQTTQAIDLSVQAQGMQTALAQKSAAVAYFVLDPKAPKPQIERLREAGIPVYAVLGEPVGLEVDAFVKVADAEHGKVSAAYLAENLQKGDEVAVISGVPTPNIEAEVAGAVEALKAAGMKVVGDANKQRNLKDNADGGREVMQGLLQRFPNLKGVFAYNDDSALGAIAVIKQAKRDIKVTSRNGSKEAVAAIVKGDLLATCDIGALEVGQTVGKAIAEQIAGGGEAQSMTSLEAPDPSECLVTKDNADQYQAPDEKISYADIKQR